MMEVEDIGGYFGLELNENVLLPHADGAYLNTGRNALEYVLRSLSCIKKIFIPYFTCDVILEPIKKIGAEYDFYHINEKLELDDDIILRDNEYLFVINYFGIKDDYIYRLTQKYRENIIVDNSQAFFSLHIDGVKTIYSPRKFIGVPDGGIAYGASHAESSYEIDVSFDRCSHLLKRIDVGVGMGYKDFKDNSLKLSNQPIRRMSALTKRIISSIDFEEIKRKRIANFVFLNDRLSFSNALCIEGQFACPMVYPYFTSNVDLRRELIEKHIFVATYWPNVLKDCPSSFVEHKLAEMIIPLPIDQRYTYKEMERICEIINMCK